MGTIVRTVYGVYYPETRRIVDALWAERPHGWYERNYTGRQDGMHVPFFDRWRDWAHEGGVALGSSFPHAYPTAGANEGIHALLALHAAHGGRRIHVFAGEYEGFGHTARALGLEVVTHPRDPEEHRRSLLRSAQPGDVFWISQPSAIDGNVWPGFDAFLAWMRECMEGTRVVVDLTYVGAVASEHRIHVDHPSVQALVFSLSKPFGVYYHRIGGLLARAEVPTLQGHLWFKNLFSVHLGERLLRTHPARDLPARYAGLQRETLARAVRAGEVPPGTRPSDVVLLAHAPGPAGEFAGYARGDGLRFCLSPGMDGALYP